MAVGKFASAFIRLDSMIFRVADLSADDDTLSVIKRVNIWFWLKQNMKYKPYSNIKKVFTTLSSIPPQHTLMMLKYCC